MGRLMITILSLVVVTVILMELAAATTYTVGDSLGWNIPPNTSYYSNWTSSKTFHIGDSLYFNWTGLHNVAATATKAEYDNCAKPTAVSLQSSGTINLTANGTLYYICTVGTHCSLGQKVAITVGTSSNTTTTVGSPPPPSSSTSITSPLSLRALFSAIVTSIVFGLFA